MRPGQSLVLCRRRRRFAIFLECFAPLPLACHAFHPTAPIRANEPTAGLMPGPTFPSARGERLSPTQMSHSALAAGTTVLAPHLPFANPVGNGSVGWKADIRSDIPLPKRL